MISPVMKAKALFSIAGAIGLATLVVAFGAPRRCLAGPPGNDGRSESIAGSRGKAATIAGLASMYDSAPCLECHRDIFDAWRKSTHSRSIFGAGKTAEAFGEAVRDGLMKWPFSGVKDVADVKVEHLMECAKCHLPQLADAQDNVAREIVAALFDWRTARNDNNGAAAEAAARTLNTLNIGCLICHNRNAVVHKWADGFPKAGDVYGSREGTHPDKGYPTLRKSPIMGESILCGQCHGLGPALDMDNPTQCSTTYGSYLYAYRATGGKENCQDCHMRKSKLGHGTKAHADPAMVKSAVDVVADTHGFFWRDERQYLPRVIVDVTLTNRAGHAIPDSLSANHRLILEVAARTADGRQPFSQARTYLPIPQRLGRGDGMGRGAYERSGVVEDTALPPNRPIREKFDIVLEPITEEGRKQGRLSTEVTVLVTLKLLTADDAEGAKWYEFRKVVKIDGER